MKKVLGLVFALNIILPSFAYEDFLISIDDTVVQIKNKTPDIIDVQVVTTLMNERDTLVVTSKKEGIGHFSIILENGKISDFKADIKENGSELSSKPEYKTFKIDDISKEMELDLPPGVEWSK